MKVTNPDYIGNYHYIPGLPVLVPEGFFKLYIKETENKGHYKNIYGIIEDALGESSFEGLINGMYVEFMKVYTPEAIAQGAAPNGIRYEGIGDGTSKQYAGQFTVINGTVKGIRMDWSADWIMWTPDIQFEHSGYSDN